MGGGQLQCAQTVQEADIPGRLIQQPLGDIMLGMKGNAYPPIFCINIRSNNGRLRDSHSKLLRRRIVRKHIH